jgi:hypothetical protein
MSGYIGQDVSRVDRGAKVTGSARSSGEIALPDLAHAEIVGARGGQRPDHLDRPPSVPRAWPGADSPQHAED